MGFLKQSYDRMTQSVVALSMLGSFAATTDVDANVLPSQQSGQQFRVLPTPPDQSCTYMLVGDIPVYNVRRFGPDDPVGEDLVLVTGAKKDKGGYTGTAVEKTRSGEYEETEKKFSLTLGAGGKPTGCSILDMKKKEQRNYHMRDNGSLSMN